MTLRIQMITHVIVIQLIIFVTFDHAEPHICDKSLVASLGELGVFHHPNYPFDYAENLDCRFNFIFKDGLGSLCFHFIKFQLRDSDHCGDDYLNFDGIGRFCGAGEWGDGVNEWDENIMQPFCVHNLNRTYTVTFRSVEYSSGGGFYAYYQIFYGLNYTKFTQKRNHFDPQLTFACPEDKVSIEKEEVCSRNGRCAGGQGWIYFYAGCPVSSKNYSNALSFEEASSTQNLTLNLWEWKKAGLPDPPYDHTTLDQGGRVMKTSYEMSSLSSLKLGVKYYVPLMSWNLSVPRFGVLPDVCLSFWYFTYASVGNIFLHVSSSSTSDYLAWYRSGNQGNGWNQGEVNLPGELAVSLKVTFAAEFHALGSLSIDDVALMPGKCYGEDISCTFENSLCGWSIIEEGAYRSWYLSPTSNPGIPKFHPTQYPGDHFMRVEPTYVETIMQSRWFEIRSSPAACLSFYFFANFTDIYQINRNLELTISAIGFEGQSVTLLYLPISKYYEWQTININFDPSIIRKVSRFRFRAYCHAGYVTMGVDNISLMYQKCLQNGLLDPLTPPPSVVESDNDGSKQDCPPQHFKCHDASHCIDRVFICNNFWDCADGSDERLCPRTGGPLKFPDNSVGHTMGHSSTLVVVVIICAVLITGIITLLFFVASKRYFRLSSIHLTSLSPALSCTDLHGNPPKPPPYSLHPPPYSPELPAYALQEHESTPLNQEMPFTRAFRGSEDII